MPTTERPLRIGELAARTGRSVYAIRWYEAQGLIPGVTRNAGGQRVYAERHVGWLELLERLRRTGMPIAEMRRYAALVRQGRASLAPQLELLQQHRLRVQQTIDAWQDALSLIDHKLALYREWAVSGRRPAPPGSDVPATPARRTTATATATRPRTRR